MFCIFILFGMKIFNRKYLKQRRQRLRNNATEAEILLWCYLKNRQLKGRKFRRQTSIKNYIVDFYCPEEKLVVELDGESHFEEENTEYDKKKDEYLNGIGIKVIRIENQEVLYNLDYVLKPIEKESNKKINNKIKNYFPLLFKEGQIPTEGRNRGGLPLLAIMLLTGFVLALSLCKHTIPG